MSRSRICKFNLGIDACQRRRRSCRRRAVGQERRALDLLDVVEASAPTKQSGNTLVHILISATTSSGLVQPYIGSFHMTQ